MTNEIENDFAEDDFAEEVKVETKAKVETKVKDKFDPKVKTPFTDKKPAKVVNTKKSTEWVFISNIKRNGKFYTEGSVCPKGELNKMKELGFVENV